MSLYQYKKNGYLAASIGSLIGAALLMYPGHFLGIGYVKMFMPNATLDGIFPPFIGFIFGWWVGEVLGCWLALGLLGYRSAVRTAKLLAMLTPVGIFFWVLSHAFLISWIGSNFNQLDSLSQLMYIIMPITISLFVLALAMYARYLAQQNTFKM